MFVSLTWHRQSCLQCRDSSRRSSCFDLHQRSVETSLRTLRSHRESSIQQENSLSRFDARVGGAGGFACPNPAKSPLATTGRRKRLPHQPATLRISDSSTSEECLRHILYSGTMQIGLIGLGLVGGALAERFTAAGFDVRSFDIDSQRPRTADSAEAVAAACSRIVLSLPTSDVVAAVVASILPHLAAGAILIDTTTGDPEHAAAMGARLAERSVHYLDAEIGGSSRQVRERDVIVLCGGDRTIHERCADVFSTFARRTFYLVTWGSGARMKLAMNLVLGLNRAVRAEGLTFAEVSLPVRNTPSQPSSALKNGNSAPVAENASPSVAVAPE